jgi:hypothetical protein
MLRQCPALIGLSRNIFLLIHVHQWFGVVEKKWVLIYSLIF